MKAQKRVSKTPPQLRTTRGGDIVHEHHSSSMSSLPSIHKNKNKKTSVVSNRRKVAPQGNLLSFSDSMPSLSKGTGMEGLVAEVSKPPVANRYKNKYK